MATGFAQWFDLTGRVVVIIGGAGLFGWQHAQAIARVGGWLVLVDLAVAAPGELLSRGLEQGPRRRAHWRVSLRAGLRRRDGAARARRHLQCRLRLGGDRARPVSLSERGRGC